jgi:hypothetical protein
MSVTVLSCIGISDLSVPEGGHRCHRCHHFLKGYPTYLRDTCTPWLVRLWCESKGRRRFVVTAVTVVIAPRHVTRQTFVGKDQLIFGKDQLISRRLIDYR